MFIIPGVKQKIKKEINMNTWFFKIEGNSSKNSEIKYPFGFFVNCLITTNEKIEEAKKWIFNDLVNEGFNSVKVLQYGKFDEFYWDDKELQQELNKLAKKSKKNPNEIHYSNFHTWKK